MIRFYHKKGLGWVFIFLGIIIALTPFTPGSILLLIGLDMVFGDKWLWWKIKREKFLKYLSAK